MKVNFLVDFEEGYDILIPLESVTGERRTLQLERIESFLKEGLSVKEIISRLGITRKSYYNLINESV